MPGQLIHFELPEPDAARARDFFAALFGWNPQARLDGSFYLIEGAPSGGLVASPDAPAPARTYFDVPNIDTAFERVRDLGGTTAPVESAPGYGRWTYCEDDQGTGFGLFERSRAETEPNPP